jgi:chromosome segregation ATPase
MEDGLNSLRWLFELGLGLLTSVAGWIVGRRKRNNLFLEDLQRSIDALAAKNAEQMNEILKLREEVVNLRTENLSQSKEILALRDDNKQLSEQVAFLREENSTLNEKVSLLTEQLSGVKTITRSKP